MRKFIRQNLVFGLYMLFVLIILEAALIYLAQEKDRYQWQFSELFSPKINAETIIIGSSKGVRGLNPKILEFGNGSAFNFSMNGSGPKYAYNWYTHYFKHNYPKPKVIIYEVNWFMFNDRWMWRQIEHDSKYLSLSESISGIIHWEHRKTFLFNKLYLLDQQMINDFFGNQGLIDVGEDISLTYHGFTPFIGVQSRKSLTTPIISVSETQKNYFNRLIDQIREDGIQLVLVNLPENLELERSDAEEVEKIVSYIEDTAEEKNVYFFNYQHILKNDSLLLYNWNHLNLKGAEVISRKLKNEIDQFY